MITTAIVLDKRRAKKSQKFPVKLRITYNGKQKYYAIEKDLSPEEFDKVIVSRPKGEFKDLSLKFGAIERKAKQIIDSLDQFSFTEFERIFFDSKFKSRKSPYELFEEKSALLKKQGRIGTATSYETSLHSLRKFRKTLSFESITAEFLHDYENWMIGKGKSQTTVGIYLRNLRAIFNEAIILKLVDPSKYPFGKRQYEIPVGRNVKKALAKDQVKLLYHYKPKEGTNEGMARDFWFLSYFLNGINITDIAYLTNKDYSGDFITILRRKTINSTRSNPKIIRIPVLPQAKELINRYRKLGSPNDYVFPILKKGMTPEQEKATIQQFTKVINKWTKRIAEDLKIDKPVTTYTARHSFATTLKRSGISTQIISELLGHTTEKTTQNYLDGFEDEQTLEAVNNLVSYL